LAKEEQVKKREQIIAEAYRRLGEILRRKKKGRKRKG